MIGIIRGSQFAPATPARRAAYFVTQISVIPTLMCANMGAGNKVGFTPLQPAALLVLAATSVLPGSARMNITLNIFTENTADFAKLNREKRLEKQSDKESCKTHRYVQRAAKVKYTIVHVP